MIAAVQLDAAAVPIAEMCRAMPSGTGCSIRSMTIS
jgi:hypothetical protein